MKFSIKSSQLISFILFFSLLLVISCGKETSQTMTEEQQELEASTVSSESDAEAEIVFNDVFDDAMGVNNEVGIEGTGTLNRITPCYTITVTRLNPPDLFPVRIVIDFGTTGCRGLDGHFRRGKIITEYTGGRLIVPGAMAVTTFEGFYVDSIKVEGTHKIKNTSTSNTADRQFTVDVVGARLTRPSGNYTEWHNHKVITQIEGQITVAPLDDIFRIEGTAGGKVKRGALIAAWESNILEPLFKKFSCRWIVKGKIRTVRGINTNTRWIAVLDFGNGNCDNEATITINGVSRQITLR
jgi:hypothetical protein